MSLLRSHRTLPALAAAPRFSCSAKVNAEVGLERAAASTKNSKILPIAASTSTSTAGFVSGCRPPACNRNSKSCNTNNDRGIEVYLSVAAITLLIALCSSYRCLLVGVGRFSSLFPDYVLFSFSASLSAFNLLIRIAALVATVVPALAVITAKSGWWSCLK